MNLWRRLATVLAVALPMTAMAVAFVCLVKANHDADVLQKASQKQAEQAEIEIICAAMFRHSAANRLRCAEGEL